MYLNVIFIYLIGINLVLFILMGMDKKKSKREGWRIPEKRLWTVAIFGGALGGFVGMRYFRHKTKHTSFVIGLPILVLLHALFVGYLVQKL